MKVNKLFCKYLLWVCRISWNTLAASTEQLLQSASTVRLDLYVIQVVPYMPDVLKQV